MIYSGQSAKIPPPPPPPSHQGFSIPLQSQALNLNALTRMHITKNLGDSAWLLLPATIELASIDDLTVIAHCAIMIHVCKTVYHDRLISHTRH